MDIWTLIDRIFTVMMPVLLCIAVVLLWYGITHTDDDSRLFVPGTRFGPASRISPEKGRSRRASVEADGYATRTAGCGLASDLHRGATRR